MHILADLIVIFGMGSTELEVDDMRLRAVGDDAVRTTLNQLAMLVESENTALVKKLPTV